MRYLLALLAVTACSGAQRADMSEGERTYRAKCTACHRPYEPTNYTPPEWTASLDKMERLNKVHLSQAERAQILQYLTGNPSGAPATSSKR